MKELKIIYRDIEELIPYANNPRAISPEAVSKVAGSIAEFGFKNPVIVDGKDVLVTGHTRLQAARKLGLTHIPTIVADELSEAQIKAFRIADNKTAEFSEWDEELLKIEIDGLMDLDVDLDIDSLGFDTEALEKLFDESSPADPVDLSDKLVESYDVIISLDGEMEQEEIYNELMGRGFTCRVSTL